MRVPLRWLGEYVDIALDPPALAERLTLLGMEVKAVIDWGGDWHNVVVGELLSVERHPRADRLSLTRVTVGSGEPLEIVCGATNIRAGQRVPVALPGSILPGGRRIERTEKMGVASNGMLCSGEELGLTVDGDGILILPPGTAVGVGLTELYGDTVLDVDVKPNRGDALSVVGLAREVAAIDGAVLRFPTIDLTESGQSTTERLSVDVTDATLCPRFVGRWVSGVVVGPSPDHIQMRLLAAGMRPVSNVVDASNYVLLELGKPIHTFDAAAVHDGRIIVRRALAGETLETLDHTLRTLDPDTLIIADPRGPIAIAGVMGGAGSEIEEGSTEIVIESAIFDPVSIRRTAFRYALRSDASLRFEKGQEWRLARIGADRTAELIVDWAGGQIAPGVVDTDPSEPPPRSVAFRPSRVNRLLGTDISATDQQALLARVGIQASTAPDGSVVRIAAGTDPLDIDPGPTEVLVAEIPTWRRDLAVEADIAEEVIRVHGYDRVPSTRPHTAMPPYRHDPLATRDLVRRLLSGAGLSEVVSSALVAPQSVERFPAHDDGELVTEPGQRASGRPVVVTNPLSSQHSVLRQSLIGSLIEVVATNVRSGREAVAVFEVGKGYGAADGQTTEWWRLGFALSGSAEPGFWDRPSRDYDLDDAKGIVDLLCTGLGFAFPFLERLTDDENLHPGRSARVSSGGHLVGRIGEVHPELTGALDIRAGRIIVGELAVAGLAGGRPADYRVGAPSRQPTVQRDLAVIVSEGTPAASVESAIRRHAGSLLRQVVLFDIYRGRPLDENDKSLAFRLTLGDEQRTLTDPEVDQLVDAVSAGLATELGARFRS